MGIRRADYQAHLLAARAPAQRPSFTVLIAWSRDGLPQDALDHVYHLARHYAQQPFVGDKLGSQRAQKHATLVLPSFYASRRCLDRQPVTDAVRHGTCWSSTQTEQVRRTLRHVIWLRGEGLALLE